MAKDILIQKKCFNYCPKCGATDPYIEWGDKEWEDIEAFQDGECLKCGCEFKEWYVYDETEYYSDTPVEKEQEEKDWYVIQLWGCVEPILHGSYSYDEVNTEIERLREEEGEYRHTFSLFSVTKGTKIEF